MAKSPSVDPTWKEIGDFTAGISTKPSPNHVPGTAATGTSNCYADVEGSLRPLPRRTASIPLGPGGLALLGVAPADRTNESYRVTGIAQRGPVFSRDTVVGSATPSEFFIGLEYYEDAGGGDSDRHLQILKYTANRGSDAAWVEIVDNTETVTDFPVRPLTHFEAGRSNSTDSSEAGPAIIAWGTGKWLQAYPNDTTPSVDSVVALPGSAGAGGAAPEVVFHQGRVVIFPLYLSETGDDTFWATNEQLYWCSVNDYTQVDPLVTGYLNQLPSLDHPSGFSVMESLTADELLLIKHDGGALTLRGDLNDWTLTNLPYVKSTGLTSCRGVATNIGMIYPSCYGGVWLWSGSPTSDKISDRLEDDFWMPPVVGDDGNSGFGAGYPTTWTAYNDWVFASNNYLFDIRTKAWWKIDSPEPIYHWASSYDERWLVGAPKQIGDVPADTATDPVLYFYDVLGVEAASSYTWISQPLVETLERMWSLQEVVIVASGTGTVTFTATSAQDQTGTTVSFPIVGAEDAAVYFRKRVPVRGTHITFSLTSTATDSDDAAPTIHKIRYGLIPADEIANRQVT